MVVALVVSHRLTVPEFYAGYYRSRAGNDSDSSSGNYLTSKCWPGGSDSEPELDRIEAR